MVHRLYTEDVNRAGIESILASKFAGYNITSAQGAYKGTPESSLVVELWDAEDSAVRAAAAEIAATNHQESVGVVRFADVVPEFVTAPAREQAVVTLQGARAAGYQWTGNEIEWQAY